MYSHINFSILYKCQLGVYNSLVFSTTLSIKKCLLAVLNSFITTRYTCLIVINLLIIKLCANNIKTEVFI